MRVLSATIRIINKQQLLIPGKAPNAIVLVMLL